MEKKPKYPKPICSVTSIFCLWKDVLYMEFCRNQMPRVQHKFTLWFDLLCPETSASHPSPKHPPSPCSWNVAGLERRHLSKRKSGLTRELFLVILIKILVFGQENFLGQFLTTHCTIGLPGWIRGRIKPKKHTQHPPKNPKSSPFPS